MRLWFVVSAVWMACSNHGSPTSDRTAYLDSLRLQHDQPEAALAACNRIESPHLHAECVTLLARRLGGAGLDVDAVCSGLATVEQQQLCRFEAIDGDGEFGPEVVAACQETGSFRERCLVHALTRHTSRKWAAVATGDEAELVVWLAHQRGAYGLDAQPRLVDDLAGRVLAKRFLKTASGRVFSVDDCGAVAASTCAAALRSVVRERSREPGFDGVCRGDDGAMRAMGLPDRMPGVVDDVGQLLDEVCRAGRSR